MKVSKHIIALFILVSFVLTVFTMQGIAYAEEAVDENTKKVLAQDFFEIRPVSDMANGAIAIIAQSRPEQERAAFMRQMRLNMDYALLESKISEVLLNIYTAEELKAMTAFYGSDVGKSITAKQGDFENTIGPILQQMLDKAFVDANYGHNGTQSRP